MLNKKVAQAGQAAINAAKEAASNGAAPTGVDGMFGDDADCVLLGYLPLFL